MNRKRCDVCVYIYPVCVYIHLYTHHMCVCVYIFLYTHRHKHKMKYYKGIKEYLEGIMPSEISKTERNTV